MPHGAAAPGPVAAADAARGLRLEQLATGLLRGGRAVRFTARGGSMAPFIRDGERVTVRPLRGAPRRGHVVLAARADGEVLLHRIVRRERGVLITRGDALGTEDAPLRPEEVCGRVVRVSGRRRLHLSWPLGLLCATALRLRRAAAAPGPLRALVRRLGLLAARA